MSDSISHIPPAVSPVHGTTLRDHVLAGMRAAPGATGEFTSLLSHVSLAIRIIASRVRNAGLAGLLGYTGETNVQGEAVQKLDSYANEVLVNVLERSGHCGIIGSEELEGAKTAGHPGKYIVLFDPLDGSSNIDLNVSIGTIFAVLRRQDATSPPTVHEALRPAETSSRRATRSTGRRRSWCSRPVKAFTSSRWTRTSASSSSRNRTCAVQTRARCIR